MLNSSYLDKPLRTESQAREDAMEKPLGENPLREPYASALELLEALETLMMRWGDYVSMAIATGESKEYVDQAIEYGKQARAAITKATGAPK